MYTVWHLTSPSTGEQRRVIRPAQIDDHRYEHAYQCIVYRGTDYAAAVAAAG